MCARLPSHAVFPPRIREALILVFLASLAARVRAQDPATAHVTHFSDSASRGRDAEKWLSRASLPAGLVRSAPGSACVQATAGVGMMVWGIMQTTSEPGSSALVQFCDLPTILFTPARWLLLLASQAPADTVPTCACQHPSCVHTPHRTPSLPSLRSLLLLP